MEVDTPSVEERIDISTEDVVIKSPAISDRDYEVIEIVYTPTEQTDIEPDNRGETTDGQYIINNNNIHTVDSLVGTRIREYRLRSTRFNSPSLYKCMQVTPDNTNIFRRSPGVSINESVS